MRDVRLSYSSISTFRQCQTKFARLYVEKDVRYESETSLEGTLVHEVLEKWMPDRSQNYRLLLKSIAREKFPDIRFEQYWGAYSLLRDFAKRKDLNSINTIAYEVAFDFVLPNGVPIRGRIDRVDTMDDGTINLVDYKTTRSYIYKNEVEESLQGAMYVLAAMYNLYPKAKGYTFTIDALRFNATTVSFTNEFLGIAMDYLEKTHDEIVALTSESAVAKVNRFCGFCPYRNECSALAEAHKTHFGEEIEPDLHAYARRILDLEEQEKTLGKLRQSLLGRLDGEMVANGKRYMNFGSCFAFYKEGAKGSILKVVDRNGGHFSHGTN
jgi:putative RecB family exonuclease